MIKNRHIRMIFVAILVLVLFYDTFQKITEKLLINVTIISPAEISSLINFLHV